MSSHRSTMMDPNLLEPPSAFHQRTKGTSRSKSTARVSLQFKGILGIRTACIQRPDMANKDFTMNKDRNVTGNNGPITHSITYWLLDDHAYSSRIMCYYRLFIFTTCGHPIWGQLVTSCPSNKSSSETSPTALTFSSSASTTEACSGHRSHPLHTRKIDSLCASCAKERQRLMSALQLDSPLMETGDWNWEPAGENSPKTPTAQAITIMRQKMKEAKLLERGRIE